MPCGVCLDRQRTDVSSGRLPVLIVGAGPTGLTLALSLARQGLACRIIDRNAEPAEHSRALAVLPRTLECLQLLGVAPAFLARGVKVNGFELYHAGRRVAGLDMGGIDSRYNHLLSIEQSETERILLEAVTAAGIAVEREFELTRFAADAHGVRAHLRHTNGTAETAECDWLVGCDGAHSAVRHGLGLPFEGAAYEDDLRLADCRIDWPLAADRGRAFLRPDGPVAAIPLPGGRWRLIAFAPPGTPEEPTLAWFAERLHGVAPAGTFLSDGEWLARFKIHRRMVPGYRVGRVFLVGDAAHIHSPIGGQGMNTGIMDAVNLGWKLAEVARGAQDALLDTYETERHPVAERVLHFTDRATRQVADTGMLSFRLRLLLLPLVLASRRLQTRLATAFSHLSVSYGGAAVGPGGGGRMIDADLVAPEGTKVRLHDLLRADCRTLFLLDGAPSRALGQPSGTNVVRVGRIPVGRIYGDTRGVLVGRYDAAAIMVRPDGMIEWIRRRR